MPGRVAPTGFASTMDEDQLRFSVVVTAVLGASWIPGDCRSFEMFAEGSPAECIEQFVATAARIFRTPRAYLRLVLPVPEHGRAWSPVAAAASVTDLTPARLLESSLWTGNRLNVHVVYDGPGIDGATASSSSRAPAPRPLGLGTTSSGDSAAGFGGPARLRDAFCLDAYVVAARTVQRRWRQWRRSRLLRRLRMLTEAFEREVKTTFIPGPLLDDCLRPDMNGDMLRGALAWSCCVKQPPAWCSAVEPPEKPISPTAFFRWLEERVATFVLSAGLWLSRSLDRLQHTGTSEFHLLSDVIHAFVQRLSVALPWVAEDSFVQVLVQKAKDSWGNPAWQRGGRKNGSYAVESAVTHHVLYSASQAISRLEAAPRTSLTKQFDDFPFLIELKRALAVLRPSPPEDRSWLLCFKMDGAPDKLLVLPLAAKKQLASLVRIVCMFFELSYCELRESGSTDVLPLDSRAVDFRHLSKLTVDQPGGRLRTSLPKSGDEAELSTRLEAYLTASGQDVNDVRGTYLTLEVLKTSADNSLKKALFEISRLWGHTVSMDVANGAVFFDRGAGVDVLLLPEDCSEQEPFFHFYDTESKEFSTLVCGIDDLVAALDDFNVEPLARMSSLRTADPSALLAAGMDLYQQFQAVASSQVYAGTGCGKAASRTATVQAAQEVGHRPAPQAEASPAVASCSSRISAEVLVMGSPDADSAAGHAAQPAAVADGQAQAAVRQSDWTAPRLTEAALCRLVPPAHQRLPIGFGLACSEGSCESLHQWSQDSRLVVSPRSSEGSVHESLNLAEAGEPAVDASSGWGSWLLPAVTNLQGLIAKVLPQTEPDSDDSCVPPLVLMREKLLREERRRAEEHRKVEPPRRTILEEQRLQLRTMKLELVKPLVVTAISCTARVLSMTTTTRMAQREVLRIAGDLVTLAPTGDLSHAIGVAALLGALGGGALGSSVGPLAAVGGAMFGSAVSQHLTALTTQSEIVDLAKDKIYFLQRSAYDDKMRLTHYETVGGPSFEAAAFVLVAQACLRGCLNVAPLLRGEMTTLDMLGQFAKDMGDGAVTLGMMKGIMFASGFGATHASGFVQAVCVATLHNPSPAAFALLAAFGILQTHWRSGGLSINDMQGRDVMLCGAAIGGMSAGFLSTVVGLTNISGLVLTSAFSQVSSLAAYDAWRRQQLRLLRQKLHDHARKFMGLPPTYTLSSLKRHWRLIARFCHPDKNKSRHAVQQFELLMHCKGILEHFLAEPAEGCELECISLGAEISQIYKRFLTLWHMLVPVRRDVPTVGSLEFLMNQDSRETDEN